MSMLAERRRKTKWVINPTKKPLWTQDSSGLEFGRKLMEKMGWSTGKGLGLKEQGIEEPLRVSYKNDTKGMGFKGRDDDWIEQQDEFNMLLSQLSNNNDTAVGENLEIEKPKVKSLELKSKHSRARVHYQKFTRGKDLSNYSEKDLACILGLNKSKEEKSKPEMVMKTESKSEYETSFGVTTINGGSIDNYFKKKYSSDKIKRSSSSKSDEATETPSENVTDSKSGFLKNEESNEEPYAEKRKHKKRKHRMEAESNTYETAGDDSEEPKCKKKKTSKLTEEDGEKSGGDNVICEEPKCKKKKTSKLTEEDGEKSGGDNVIFETIENICEEPKCKKKKASKSKEEPSKIDETQKSEPDNDCCENIANDNEEVKCKKRKKSKSKEDTDKSGAEISHETRVKESEDQECKKVKTSKSKEEPSEAENVNYESVEEENKKRKKKKASKSKEDIENLEAKADNVIYETTESISEEQKSKKKKTSRSKGEQPKTDETEKCEVNEMETTKEKNEKSEAVETDFEERKIKRNKRREKIEDGRKTGETIERTYCSPLDEPLPVVLKEKNTKNEEKKSKHEKHKLQSEPQSIALPSVEDTVEHEDSALPKEKKLKKKKHKSEMEESERSEGGDVNKADQPGEGDEKGKRELGDILEGKYGIKRKGESSLETKKEAVGGVLVSESNSKMVTSGVDSERQFTSEKILDLIQWANIKEFRGSNLKNVLGYGIKKEIFNNKVA